MRAVTAQTFWLNVIPGTIRPAMMCWSMPPAAPGSGTIGRFVGTATGIVGLVVAGRRGEGRIYAPVLSPTGPAVRKKDLADRQAGRGPPGDEDTSPPVG